MVETIEINGQGYRIGRLDVKRQFHVARRLAPLLAGLGGALKNSADKDSVGFSELVAPIAEALSKMSDEDTDYVIDSCLSVVQRQSGNAWAPVMARGGGMMFSDIELSEMLRLTVAVIQGSLGGFFPGAPSPT
ncbi:phage tail assembly chaperone [Robbsia andropogonis]|uniref:phage tail assembly chaperone n=1 Tax=Robbsia andropogonis TaxID=28092 RepID=UPI000465D25B|nr:hypothetical protein [Robbsia andropogonis]